MSFIYQSKLFRQLIIVIGFLIILAVGIPSIFSWFYATPKMVQDRYYQVMIDDVDFLAERLDWLLEKGMQNVDYLSSQISTVDSAALPGVAENLNLFVKGSTIFTGGLVIDTNGTVLLLNRSPEGNVKVSELNDVSERDYFIYPLANKRQVYLSDVIITKDNFHPVIMISRSLGESEVTPGVLALSINLLNDENIFQSLFRSFQENKRGSIYVVDGHGNVVYHANKESLGQATNPSVFSRITEQQNDIDLLRDNGDAAVAFARLKNTQWTVIYEISHRDIYATTTMASYMSVGTAVLVLILGVLVSIVFVKIILKPLEEITYATERVAAGDMTKKIDYNSQNDFSKVIRNFNIMTEKLQLQYAELQKLSLRDYLTGLANRRYFQQQFQQELERACRMRHPSSILILDIDDFKKINDKFGHLEGDRALKALAQQMQEGLRESDLPARFGGEEFVVLLPETSLEEGKIVAEKIRKNVSEISIDSRKGEIRFTVSIGIAGTEQVDDFACQSIDKMCESLLENADKALYQAKRNGKNRVETN